MKWNEMKWNEMKWNKMKQKQKPFILVSIEWVAPAAPFANFWTTT